MNREVGERVIYQGEVFYIESCYNNGVYLIGNKDSFADLVIEEDLDD